MNRREFIQAGSGVLGAALFSTGAVGQGDLKPLRTITYNVLACRGYPETDTNRERLRRARPQMVERFALELALYEPDLVTFQESPSEAMIAAIARAMGQEFWSNAVLARRGSAARVLFEGPFRTNPEDPRSFALSDHLPVLADFGG
jgi:hypothetical protein